MTVHVHVTHEAVRKVGGIGAVLQGLLTAGSYRRAVRRTLLVGPLVDRHRRDPLGAEATILYDNWQGIWCEEFGPALQTIEVARGVRLVYGRRPFRCPDGSTVAAEVVLVDVESSIPRGLNAFKRALYDRYGLASDRYEGQWEYEQYLRLAEPAFDAVVALLGETDEVCWFIAHEFMGLPTALRATLAPDRRFRTAFYAHEVATARRIVENHPGHDVTFYPVLKRALEESRCVEDLFGPQDDYFKHALVRQAIHCDALLAVGDRVVDELRFLGAGFAQAPIDVVYNGLPETPPLDLRARKQARGMLADVVQEMLGFRPGLVFTHVSRLVSSKGMWRDLLVLGRMEASLRRWRGGAVLLVLATEAGPRLPASTRHMHLEYDWPVVHREGYPDLSPGELAFDLRVRRHNARARHSRVLFINQFGFDASSCGGALPEGVGFDALRQGSDAEFGQSIYEPFGIAQIEPIGFGAVSVVSDACGCVGFLDVAQAAAPEMASRVPTHIVGTYARPTGGTALAGAQLQRLQEERVSGQVAARLAAALPTNERQRQERLTVGHAVAARMSWERVVTTQLLPALARAGQRAGAG